MYLKNYDSSVAQDMGGDDDDWETDSSFVNTTSVKSGAKPSQDTIEKAKTTAGNYGGGAVYSAPANVATLAPSKPAPSPVAKPAPAPVAKPAPAPAPAPVAKPSGFGAAAAKFNQPAAAPAPLKPAPAPVKPAPAPIAKPAPVAAKPAPAPSKPAPAAAVKGAHIPIVNQAAPAWASTVKRAPDADEDDGGWDDEPAAPAKPAAKFAPAPAAKPTPPAPSKPAPAPVPEPEPEPAYDYSQDNTESYQETGYEQEAGYDQSQDTSAHFTVTALYDYVGENEGDLGFWANEVITVTDTNDPDGWWYGYVDDREGVFPSTYVQYNEY